MTDEPDRSLNALWMAFDLLSARQEAIEYLAVEMIAARFAHMPEAEIAIECEHLGSKLLLWPPVWPREPMAVDDLDARRAQLDHAVAELLSRAGQRAELIAIQSGARQVTLDHSPRERERIVRVVNDALRKGEIELPRGG